MMSEITPPLIGVLFASGLAISYVIGKIHGREDGQHGHRCPAPDERFKGAQSYWQSLMMKAEKERQFWYGKYTIVKHENNKLRRKVQNGTRV